MIVLSAIVLFVLADELFGRLVGVARLGLVGDWGVEVGCVLFARLATIALVASVGLFVRVVVARVERFGFVLVAVGRVVPFEFVPADDFGISWQ